MFKANKGRLMKGKLLLAVMLAACLCLCACSSRDIGLSESSGSLVPSSQTEELLNESEVSEPSAEPSSPSSLDYEVQILPKETMDSLSANGFRWGDRGSPELSVKWSDRDELLFFLYKIDESNELCRIFSYIPSTNTLTMLEELSGKGAAGIVYFLQNDVSYLLWNNPYSPQICQIDHGASKVMQIEPFMGTPSPAGELAVVEWGKPAVILRDLLNPEEDHTKFQIEHQEEFIGWSPDGQYLTFYQSENGQYTIYDRQGNLKQSVLSDQLHWCEEPNFIASHTLNGDEDKWKLLNIAENTETLLPSYPEGTILIQEPDFALIRQNNIMIFDHKTGECIPIEVSGFENSVLEFADYNWETRTVALACWSEMNLDNELIQQWPTCYLIKLFSRS